MSDLSIRAAGPVDAEAIAAIYAPIVATTAISFETEAPDAAEIGARIAQTQQRLPWLVGVDASGRVLGYAYASRHRERAAYRWSVDTTVYIHEDARGRGLGGALYRELFRQLVALGYFQAFAIIVLPNDGSVALHESVGFRPVGVCRNAGFKLGEWRDVGWWQCELQTPVDPAEPRLPVG